jgi:dTMP kinase
MGRSSTALPGKLIAVEGVDGSGKSTQISLLKRWLELEGCRVFFTEWNSSAVVKQITKKGKRRKMLSPTTFSLIHCADFADRYERQILPLLHAGYLVLADRYVYTAFARDGVRGCDPRWLRSLYSFAQPPDLTFYFNVSLEVALNRILASRPALKYYEAGMDLDLATNAEESFRIFQSLILTEYGKLAQEYDFTVIDALLAPEKQQEGMRTALKRMIDLSTFKHPPGARSLHHD